MPHPRRRERRVPRALPLRHLPGAAALLGGGRAGRRHQPRGNNQICRAARAAALPLDAGLSTRGVGALGRGGVSAHGRKDHLVYDHPWLCCPVLRPRYLRAAAEKANVVLGRHGGGRRSDHRSEAVQPRKCSHVEGLLPVVLGRSPGGNMEPRRRADLADPGRLCRHPDPCRVLFENLQKIYAAIDGRRGRAPNHCAARMKKRNGTRATSRKDVCNFDCRDRRPRRSLMRT